MPRLALWLAFGVLGVAGCRARASDPEVRDGGLAEPVVQPDASLDRFVYPDAGPPPDLAAACNCPDAIGPLLPLPLECACPWSGPSCPATVEDFVRRFCADDAPLVRLVGCGKLTFRIASGYSGTTPIFDLASGQLIGVHDWSDTVFGRCRASNYLFGSGLFPADDPYAPPGDVCPDISSCTICGPPDQRYPRCPS